VFCFFCEIIVVHSSLIVLNVLVFEPQLILIRFRHNKKNINNTSKTLETVHVNSMVDLIRIARILHAFITLHRLQSYVIKQTNSSEH